MIPAHWPQPRKTTGLGLTPVKLGLGDPTADFQSLLYTSNDPNQLTAGARSALSAQAGQLASDNPGVMVAAGQVDNAIATYDSDGNAQQAAQGAMTAAGGGQPSDQEIQAGFALAAEGAAVAAGMTLAAASVVIAPIALVVFGGGEALGSLIKSALGITNASPVACSSTDPTKYGTDPSDPHWITFQYYVDHNAPPPNGWPNPDPAGRQHWLPYTSGAFETWARPLIIRAFELTANCKPLPGCPYWRAYAAGLVAAWNKQFPGAPMRTIGAPPQQPNDGYGQPGQLLEYRYKNDPIWWLIQNAAVDQYQQGTNTIVAPALPQSQWNIRVANPPPSTGGASSAVGAVATGAAAAAATGAVAVVAYSYATGKALDVVFKGLWKGITGVFR